MRDVARAGFSAVRRSLDKSAHGVGVSESEREKRERERKSRIFDRLLSQLMEWEWVTVRVSATSGYVCERETRTTESHAFVCACPSQGEINLRCPNPQFAMGGGVHEIDRNWYNWWTLNLNTRKRHTRTCIHTPTCKQFCSTTNSSYPCQPPRNCCGHLLQTFPNHTHQSHSHTVSHMIPVKNMPTSNLD